jgi:hypothetical protein
MGRVWLERRVVRGYGSSGAAYYYGGSSGRLRFIRADRREAMGHVGPLRRLHAHVHNHLSAHSCTARRDDGLATQVAHRDTTRRHDPPVMDLSGGSSGGYGSSGHVGVSHGSSVGGIHRRRVLRRKRLFQRRFLGWIPQWSCLQQSLPTDGKLRLDLGHFEFDAHGTLPRRV